MFVADTTFAGAFQGYQTRRIRSALIDARLWRSRAHLQSQTLGGMGNEPNHGLTQHTPPRPPQVDNAEAIREMEELDLHNPTTSIPGVGEEPWIDDRTQERDWLPGGEIQHDQSQITGRHC